MDVILGEDGKVAHHQMQHGLLRGSFGLIAIASFGLVIRGLVFGGPTRTAVLAMLVGGGSWFWSNRKGAPLRGLGILFCMILVALIVLGALDLGGAAGPALCLSFVPGLLSMLVLGPRWGIAVTASMLVANGWLAVTTPLSSDYDRLRFQDQILMALFASGLGYALSNSFFEYEGALARRKRALLRARERRQALTATVYEELDPLCAQLLDILALPPDSTARASFSALLERMSKALDGSRTLARKHHLSSLYETDQDKAIRIRVMRIWLRIGVAFLVTVMIRNYWAGYDFVPSLFSVAFCLVLDLWLGARTARVSLEWVAFSIGILATGPLVGHIHAYGPTADAPALVITPSILLFTALLSQGPATWAIICVQGAILVWVGSGPPLTLAQSHLLGDLAVGFLIVAFALRNVFRLRHRYAQVLRRQGQELVEAERRHRRLSGTLFHDVRNYLQTLMFQVDDYDDPETSEYTRSLGLRIARLIGLSKELLLEDPPAQAPDLRTVRLDQILNSLTEVYGPQLRSKGLHFSAPPKTSLEVVAAPELLVESVLGNLLSNAIKFSPPRSSIELDARPDGDRVRITLRDEGPGIPKEVLERLGSEGALPSLLGTCGEEGQGYGLQLVREHLERMNGDLTLRSGHPRGAEALVWLPAPGHSINQDRGSETGDDIGLESRS